VGEEGSNVCKLFRPSQQPKTDESAEDAEIESKFKEDNLVDYSNRTGSEFASNVPAFIYLLFAWLGEKKNLKAHVSIQHKAKDFVDSSGNLVPLEKAPNLPAKLFRMKIQYAREPKISIPDAIVSLASNGTVLPRKAKAGITIDNLLDDCEWEEGVLNTAIIGAGGNDDYDSLRQY
jgi:hypothetical protein